MAATRAPAAPASLVVAKTMLTATLLRPDPTQAAVAKDDIQSFHSLLDAAVLTCSPSNLQNCKEWLLKNIVTSNKRADALGKYLARLAQSFAESQNSRKPSKRDAPSSRRKALHLLYLLNDLIHHVRVHDGPLADLAKALEPHLDLIFVAAFSLQLPGKSKLRQRLAKLTELYEDENLYGKSYRERVRRALQDASVPTAITSGAAEAHATTSSKEVPYALPAFHGEPNDPWPINPHNIKAVDLRNKTAEMGLVNAVKDLLNYSESLYNEDEGIVADIDMMGQPLVRDEVTGELTVTEGYYGWSVDFCERMKKRRKEAKSRGRDARPARSRSYSSSRSRSRSDDRGRTNRYRESRRSPPPSRNGPGQSPPFHQQPPPPHPFAAPGQPFAPPPPPVQYTGQFPTFPPNFQPPPPPPNYQGPWPPPPPPLAPNSNYNQPFPPFPPQPNMPMGGNQGNHWNQNNGYDRGRGRRY
ncbi:hypothetical protein MPH_03815 [Macrophomina phaseolina MS6]|uniref:CID domain-containing protein n=1 Tax=Macrophomina phaseolina (strain MS6) TaxID=1126212 RepID=K2R8Z8_MACPH|nr:hypothetical protein MPH_03815 [Macrophomina phaseolina MS6]